MDEQKYFQSQVLSQLRAIEQKLTQLEQEIRTIKGRV